VGAVNKVHISSKWTCN